MPCMVLSHRNKQTRKKNTHATKAKSNKCDAIEFRTPVSYHFHWVCSAHCFMLNHFMLAVIGFTLIKYGMHTPIRQ